MKTQLVYKVVDGKNPFVSLTYNYIPHIYGLIYRLNERTYPINGLIFTFDSLEYAKQYDLPFDTTILKGIGYNPRRLKVVCNRTIDFDNFWKNYFAKKSTQKYALRLLKSTRFIGVESFLPLEIVK